MYGVHSVRCACRYLLFTLPHPAPPCPNPIAYTSPPSLAHMHTHGCTHAPSPPPTQLQTKTHTHPPTHNLVTPTHSPAHPQVASMLLGVPEDKLKACVESVARPELQPQAFSPLPPSPSTPPPTPAYAALLERCVAAGDAWNGPPWMPPAAERRGSQVGHLDLPYPTLIIQ